MPKRKHICDVPGCSSDRKRWQRLCEHHFCCLPHHIRSGLISAFKQRRHADHRAWKKAAKTWLDQEPQNQPRRSAPTAEHTYAMNTRLLGERTD